MHFGYGNLAMALCHFRELTLRGGRHSQQSESLVCAELHYVPLADCGQALEMQSSMALKQLTKRIARHFWSLQLQQSIGALQPDNPLKTANTLNKQMQMGTRQPQALQYPCGSSSFQKSTQSAKICITIFCLFNSTLLPSKAFYRTPAALEEPLDTLLFSEKITLWDFPSLLQWIAAFQTYHELGAPPLDLGKSMRCERLRDSLRRNATASAIAPVQPPLNERCVAQSLWSLQENTKRRSSIAMWRNDQHSKRMQSRTIDTTQPPAQSEGGRLRSDSAMHLIGIQIRILQFPGSRTSRV